MPNLPFSPEGRSALAVPPGRAELMKALEEGSILQARVTMCDAGHNLLVDLGDIRGIIPREEAVFFPGGEQPREIAILSRVGRTVCFTVTGPVRDLPDGRCVTLSRRQAQERAAAFFMSSLTPGDLIGGRVTHIKPFGVFVDIGCGIPAFIGIENLSVSRISHPSDRLSRGQDILTAVLSVDRARGRVTLTHKELLGTWEQNAALFSPGQTVTGIVRGIEEYGVFIELAPNLPGLAEYRPGLAAGNPVSVYIKSISPERMKIKLNVIDVLDVPPAAPGPPRYFISSGHMDRWIYSPACCLSKHVETNFQNA